LEPFIEENELNPRNSSKAVVLCNQDDLQLALSGLLKLPGPIGAVLGQFHQGWQELLIQSVDVVEDQRPFLEVS